MTDGTTSGATKCASSTARPRKRPRISRYAASVPSPTARTLDTPATIREFAAASRQAASAKNSPYQRSESPGGGNRRDAALENDIGMTMMMGKRRNVSAAPATAARATRSTRPTIRSPAVPARLLDTSRSIRGVTGGSMARMSPNRPADQIEGAHQEQEQRRDRGRELPARERVDQHVEHVGDHRNPAPAQDRRGDVEAECEHEYEDRAGHDRRHRQREEHAPEDRSLGGPERGGRPEEALVDPQHGHVERQDEEGQQDVDGADDHAELVIED